MRKLAIPLLLLMLAGCSSPTDEPAREWIKFMEAQQKLVEAGDFDKDAFMKQGKEIADRLNAHRNPKEGRPLATKKVLNKWQEANSNFEAACRERKNTVALVAYREVGDYMMEGWPPP